MKYFIFYTKKAHMIFSYNKEPKNFLHSFNQNNSKAINDWVFRLSKLGALDWDQAKKSNNQFNTSQATIIFNRGIVIPECSPQISQIIQLPCSVILSSKDPEDRGLSMWK